MLNDFYHMLDPVAISAGPITIYWYGLAYVVGALCSRRSSCTAHSVAGALTSRLTT